MLLKSGMTQQQIDALDAKVIQSFGGVLTAAQEAALKAESDKKAATEAAAKAEAERKAAAADLDRAGLERRSNVEFYEQKIVPGLTSWEEEKKKLMSDLTNANAMANYYKTQNEGARESGFVPKEAPVFTPPAGVTPPAAAGGGAAYVPNVPGSTPGSPVFQFDPNTFKKEMAGATLEIENLRWKYGQLFGGKPLPISPGELIAQAEANKLSPTDYASRIFKFSDREAEMAREVAAAHDAEIAKTATAELEKKHADEVKRLQDEFNAKERARIENGGNNPDVRQIGPSRVTELRKAVAEGTRPDPLKMTDAERRLATRKAIHSEIADREMAGTTA